MLFIDEMVERHIREAQAKGEFDCLPGAGKPLELDDTSAVPAELRVAYRILKNSGYLPPELEARKEALELDTLLHEIHKEDPQYDVISQKLRVLELRLQQAGINTDFLKGEYQQRISEKLSAHSAKK
ncbi:DUF1992 domain-containing protein [Nissabacter sp. SGAir0207]|uniref:DnaJ family domain-containing protein n=1 Tax=Nissabacter sp. SGAir0207 TaxID=2126321 RepID=UPI0010CD1B36|nr:DUF1992 domain-containing protein [Nissabacter sp. SGAir0207]QCR34851.1 hypothetical protein C1N62_01475 [Nissabacter sp. SGAir0207]